MGFEESPAPCKFYLANSPMVTSKKDIRNIPVETLHNMYYMLVKIRRVEERIAELYPEQEMRCPTHLSIGQEAVAVGVCANLHKEDYVFSIHRCHAHYMAKGGDVGRMVAELYGKKTGCAKGKGGSMHFVAPEVGFMGASAIVAGTLPIAMGTALASAMQGVDRVSIAFFGDSAVEEGTFQETLNFAALKKLPVIFISENNLYATHSHVSARQPADNIYQRGEIYGIPGLRIDGNDLLEVYWAAVDAIDRARRGGGPSLIECKTYRWREHVGPNYDYAMGYRTKEELELWMARCPVKLYEEKLKDSNVMTQEETEKIRQKVDQEVEEAVVFAKKSPFPEETELLKDLY